MIDQLNNNIEYKMKCFMIKWELHNQYRNHEGVLRNWCCL